VAAILAASGLAVREVSAPREKLEDLFLRIVQEAKDRKQATGGAVAGGAVAEFLRGPAAAGEQAAGRALVEGLVAAASGEKHARAAQAAQAAAAAEAHPQPIEPATQVIDDLVGAAAGKDNQGTGGGAAGEPTSGGPTKQPDADRAVIDELLGKDARRRG